MPECPICGNSIKTTPNTVTVFIGSSNSNSSIAKKLSSASPSDFVERKMGMYACDKCLTRFPVVLDRRHYVMVPIKQLRDMQSDIKRLTDGQEKLSTKLDQANEAKKESEGLLKRSIDEAELKKLEDRLAYLQAHVTHLKKDKEELQEKISALAR